MISLDNCSGRFFPQRRKIAARKSTKKSGLSPPPKKGEKSVLPKTGPNTFIPARRKCRTSKSALAQLSGDYTGVLQLRYRFSRYTVGPQAPEAGRDETLTFQPQDTD